MGLIFEDYMLKLICKVFKIVTLTVESIMLVVRFKTVAILAVHQINLYESCSFRVTEKRLTYHFDYCCTARRPLYNQIKRLVCQFILLVAVICTKLE